MLKANGQNIGYQFPFPKGTEYGDLNEVKGLGAYWIGSNSTQANLPTVDGNPAMTLLVFPTRSQSGAVDVITQLILAHGGTASIHFRIWDGGSSAWTAWKTLS